MYLIISYINIQLIVQKVLGYIVTFNYSVKYFSCVIQSGTPVTRTLNEKRKTVRVSGNSSYRSKFQ